MTQRFGAEAFASKSEAVLQWLGMAGLLINSRGTTLMVDPLLGGFDMHVMMEFPISAEDVPAWTPFSSLTATTTTTASLPVATWPASPVNITRPSTSPR